MPTHDDIDLSQISAADFLAAMQGGDDLDLDNMSAEDLLALEEELQGEDDIEKIASSEAGRVAIAQGRLMARGYAAEMQKLASADEIYDLSQLSARDLVAALDSGEFEIVEGDELEKDAGAGWDALKRSAGKSWTGVKGKGSRAWELLKGTNVSKNISEVAGEGATLGQRLKTRAAILGGLDTGGFKGNKTMTSEARKTALMRGGAAATLGGGAYAGKRYLRRKDKKK